MQSLWEIICSFLLNIHWLQDTTIPFFNPPEKCEGDQPWDFFGRNDAEDETPVLWPPHVKS